MRRLAMISLIVCILLFIYNFSFVEARYVDGGCEATIPEEPWGDSAVVESPTYYCQCYVDFFCGTWEAWCEVD